MALTPIKFSDLAAMAALDGTEIFPGVQAGVNKSATADDIKTFVLTGLAGTNRRTTDAAFTLAPLTDAPDQLCEGTLTADRAVTLSTTGAYNGARFRITRTGGGAFNYTVAHNGGTKNIATNQWAEFVYYSALSAWQLAAAGAL